MFVRKTQTLGYCECLQSRCASFVFAAAVHSWFSQLHSVGADLSSEILATPCRGSKTEAGWGGGKALTWGKYISNLKKFNSTRGNTNFVPVDPK